MVTTPRDTPAGRVFNDLRNKAREEGRATDELLLLYVLERWLYRAAISQHADLLVLKGGLLLAALDARRPTRDGDLLAYLQGDEDEVVRCICEIADIDVDDGAKFDVSGVRRTSIREDGHYAGVRVTMPVALGRARVKLALDVNFGDPVTPGAVRVDYPLLLPATPFQVLAYPVETVLAEKVTTAVARGETNTRDRDWADLWRLTDVHDLSGGVMTDALRRTAACRDVECTPLADRLGALVDRRTVPYRRWLRRQGRDASRYPQELADVVADVLDFTEPLLTGIVADRRWDPERRLWREPI